MKMLRRPLIPIALAFTSQVAFAQWTTTNLTPDGAYASDCRAVFGNRQAGSFLALVGGNPSGDTVIWNGSANSWASFPGAVSALSADQVAGTISSFSDFSQHAAVWSGDSYSLTDLHQAVFQSSRAFGVSGGQQVGRAVIDSMAHALLWHGTAESWVDLNPVGFSNSTAYATNGMSQVGIVAASGIGTHAARWSGTAESFVDLTPTGSTESWATSISSKTVGGYACPHGRVHAGYWTGGPDTFVDLSPANDTYSWCLGVTDDFQVGYITDFNGATRAAFWSGTADSFVDLQSFLPANFNSSSATGVWSDGSIVRVVGNAYNSDTGQQEAFMWTQPVPEPASWAGLVGGLVFLARRRRIMRK